MSRLHSRLLPAFLALSSIPLIVLTGCGAATSFSNPSTSVAFKGKVYGGQQPVSGSTVTIWAAGVTGYGSAALPLSSTITQADGSFDFSTATPYVCTPGEQVYITAAGGTSVPGDTNPSNPLNPNPNNNIMLATGLGDCAAAQTATVEINEVTTAVTAFALAQFFTPTLGTSSTDSFGTDPADLTAFTNSNQYLIPTLIDIPSGMVQPNTPNITIEAAKIYSIANTLASCVNDAAGFPNCNTLFTDTTPPGRGATTPSDTLQAAVQMALRPYQNIHGLYTLATKTPPFTGLSAQPNDWTIGVSYISPNFALAVATTNTSATSASIDIDANGKIWFPSSLSGNSGVAYFDPTAATFNGPYLVNLFLQPQYVAIDSNGLIWMTDALTSTVGYDDTSNPAGTNTAAGNFGPGPILGPIASDAVGDTLFSYVDATDGNLLLFTTSTFMPGPVATFQQPPTGLAVTADFAYASTSGSSTACNLEYTYGPPPTTVASTSSNCTSGGVAFASGANDVLGMATSLNQFCFLDEGGCGGPPSAYAADVNLPEGVATDGYGNEWIANSGNASVFTFGGVFSGSSGYANTSPVAYLHDSNNGNTMTTPYAIAIDGSGNVWVANAGCVGAPCTPGSFVLSELIGAAGPTITPLSSQMVDDGILVGQLPGTPPPVAESSGTPRRFGPTPDTQASPKPWSKLSGKPLVFIR